MSYSSKIEWSLEQINSSLHGTLPVTLLYLYYLPRTHFLTV